MFPKRVILPAASAVALAMPLHAASHVADLTSFDSIIGESQSSGFPPGYMTNSYSGQVGVGGADGARHNRNLVVGFTLPVLDGPITSATFSLTIESAGTNGGGNFSVQVYGLSTTDPDGSGTSLFYEGGADPDPGATLLSSSFIWSGSSQANSGTVVTLDIADFLSTFYTGNTPNQQEVFLRLSPDTDMNVNGSIRRVTFLQDSGTLTINTDAIPEPSAALLGILGAFAGVARRKR